MDDNITIVGLQYFDTNKYQNSNFKIDKQKFYFKLKTRKID